MNAHITQEQADEYAIGSLEPELERVVALHLAECTECRDVARDSERLASRIGLSTPIVAPPAPDRLRRRVFTSVGIARPSLPHRAFIYARTIGGLAAGIVALLAFVAMLGLRDQIDDLREQNVAFEKKLDSTSSLQIEVAALSQKASEQARALALADAEAAQDRELQVALLSPDAKTAEVLPVGDEAPAVGRLVWDSKQKRLWFVATDMSQLDSGKVYQIWINNGGQYVPLGTFNPDRSGFIRFTTVVPEGLGDYESAAVTIERAGGADVRVTAPLFVANLENFRR